MVLVKKSITVTEQQDKWIQAQIAKGYYASDSEIFRELIRERQIREEETVKKIETLRTALIEGEQSGFSDRTPDEIMNAVIERRNNEAL